jgi:CheY-like chemotaxis protein
MKEGSMPDMDQVTILIVEDDPGHARLIELNLRRAGISNDILWFDDGQKVVDFVHKDEQRAGAGPAAPVLLLLDLNMPGLNGYQVLERIRSREYTRHLPVVILTTTDEECEITRCYELGCNVYITKPVDYDKFSEAVRRLGLLFCVMKTPEGVKKQAASEHDS